MPYIGNQPSESFTSFATQEFSTSATTSYTLDHAVTNENEIALFVNNVRQQPGSGKAYTATGTALTLSAATASTDTMYCVFLGRALQTVTPATNSITAAMVGNDLISGKDALTSSPADTDEFLISDAGTIKRIDASLVVGGGKILQVVSGTDNTTYAITTNSVTDDYAGSTAFTITPSATNSKIMIHFFVGQVMSQNGSGLRFRIYRQIGGSGGFTNVTALGGADSSNRKGAVAGNFGSHTDGEDENRSRTLGGTVVDSPNTTSAVEYKLYYGSGDTVQRNIHVNRTRGDGDQNYTNRTITHVTLLEVGA